MTRILLLTVLASAQGHTVLCTATSKNIHVEPARQNGSAARGVVAGTLQILTDKEGVDFNDYIRDAYLSVKKHWVAKMPGSLMKGQQGINAVEFHILQDGSVPKDSVKMVTSSEKTDFDAASLEAIQEAAPFKHLPEKFTKPFVEVRFTFYYNLPLPQSPR